MLTTLMLMETYLCSQETADVAIDLEDTFSSVNYEHLVKCIIDCDINAWLVNWIT